MANQTSSGNQASSVCRICQDAYFLPDMARCWRCGKLIPQAHTQAHTQGSEENSAKGLICWDCQVGRGPRSLARVTVLGHFHGGWRDFIHTVKYRRNPHLLTFVAEEACRWAGGRLPVPDVITAIPMHEEKLRERGFNQAQVLASLMAWRLAVPYRPLMERERPNVAQMGLDRRARLRNVDRVFRLHEESWEMGRLQGRVCWLIDDVTTTGATLEQGARVLLAGGAERVYGFCLAAALGAVGEHPSL
ncbi:MAG: ComF family protein [Peptococcaceae bacterium]|nr:ComF family protein [Peptococcaceae bacterium]